MSLQRLSAVELFRGASEKEARKISELCAVRRFPEGATIYGEGDLCDSLYILKSGVVKLISISPKGSEAILQIVKPGQVFGELLLSRERRAFTALAAEDSTVTVISRQNLRRLLSLVPVLALNFIQVLSRRLAEVEKGLAESSHTWSYHRLARVLLQLSQQYGEEDSAGTLIQLRLTHEDLANLIGTTRETVTTQLNRFSRMGLLSRRARQFVICQPRLIRFIHSEDLRARQYHVVAGSNRQRYRTN